MAYRERLLASGVPSQLTIETAPTVVEMTDHGSD